LEGVLGLVLESLRSGVLVVDDGRTITHLNAGLARRFGYPPEDLIGRSVDVLLSGTPRDTLPAAREGLETLGAESANGDPFERRNGFPIVIAPPQGARAGLGFESPGDANGGQPAPPDQAAISERIEFERLVADLSLRFINVAADGIDDAIRQSLAQIGEALDLDRCLFVTIDAGVLAHTVSWQAPGVQDIPVPANAAERFPWALKATMAGEMVCFSTLEEIPSEVDRESYRALDIRASLAVPLSVDGNVLGAVGFNLVGRQRTWSPEDVHRLRVVASAFGNVLSRRQGDAALRRAMAEVDRLRERLQAENAYLRREVETRTAGSVIGQSRAIRSVLEQLQQVAATDATVLLLGETGTGKELFATQIHELSSRHGRAMVRVNCSAIPSTLIESELFGREKGAFTGALARQIGRFELADHSTIFLDEIGELPAEVQVKLLRVLEERQIERLGSPRAIRVDTRIVAATHRNLEQRITEGQFREDLFYRLNVFPIVVPPLRERVEDIPLLVQRFVDEFSMLFGKRIDSVSPDSMAALQRYPWPGNIRELRNVVERAMIITTGPRLTVNVPASNGTTSRRSLKLADVETEHIRNVLEQTGWRIRGSGGAADQLGLKPTTLETRMAKLGLRRPKLR
jgi:transcriptional regulator with GAF, ATPase, and Fis domain